MRDTHVRVKMPLTHVACTLVKSRNQARDGIDQGMKAMAAHFRYISKKGRLDIGKIAGRPSTARSRWRTGGRVALQRQLHP
jgi:hypothetical protein